MHWGLLTLLLLLWTSGAVVCRATLLQPIPQQVWEKPEIDKRAAEAARRAAADIYLFDAPDPKRWEEEDALPDWEDEPDDTVREIIGEHPLELLANPHVRNPFEGVADRETDYDDEADEEGADDADQDAAVEEWEEERAAEAAPLIEGLEM